MRAVQGVLCLEAEKNHTAKQENYRNAVSRSGLPVFISTGKAQ
jgi:hypothetical protein